jgi:hypothetical protein
MLMICVEAPEQQRVAVGLRARHRDGADRTAAAGAVLDHERLAELVGEIAAGEPRHHVGVAARRIGHDDRNRTRRPGGGMRANRGSGQRGGRQAEADGAAGNGRSDVS